MLKKILIVLFILPSLLYGKIRVLSLTLGGDEILVGLGAKNIMVGVCGNIVDNEKYSNIVGQVKNYKRVENNLEEILYLNPNLVIVADWMSKDKIQHLENSGINVFKYKTPKTFKDLIENIRQFENKLGVNIEKNNLLENLELRINKIKEKALKIKKKKRVLFYSNYGTTGGKDTLFDNISKISNFINVASINGIYGNTKISKEKIIEFDPEVIIIPSYSISNNDPFLKEILNDKSLKTVKAIKNKEIYSVKGKYLMTSSHHMINALEIIFKKVYPEL